jgi:hypothetical protein
VSEPVKFSWQVVTLACTERDQVVHALVLGPLAVHRRIDAEEECWTITHIESGLKAAPDFVQVEAALDLCSLLAPLDGWDGITREARVGGTAKAPRTLRDRARTLTDGFVATLKLPKVPRA